MCWSRCSIESLRVLLYFSPRRCRMRRRICCGCRPARCRCRAPLRGRLLRDSFPTILCRCRPHGNILPPSSLRSRYFCCRAASRWTGCARRRCIFFLDECSRRMRRYRCSPRRRERRMWGFRPPRGSGTGSSGLHPEPLPHRAGCRSFGNGWSRAPLCRVLCWGIREIRTGR